MLSGARIPSVNPINKLDREEFHTQYFHPAPRILRVERECVCECVYEMVQVLATTLNVKMATDGRLHLANRTSSHLVKMGAYRCVNGKGQDGNAVKESSPRCSWSDETVITGCGYRGNQSSWQVSQKHECWMKSLDKTLFVSMCHSKQSYHGLWKKLHPIFNRIIA